MRSIKDAAAAVMREAMPVPIVTVVVAEGAVERWKEAASADELVEFSRMVDAGVIEVRS